MREATAHSPGRRILPRFSPGEALFVWGTSVQVTIEIEACWAGVSAGHPSAGGLPDGHQFGIGIGSGGTTASGSVDWLRGPPAARRQERPSRWHRSATGPRPFRRQRHRHPLSLRHLPDLCPTGHPERVRRARAPGRRGHGERHPDQDPGLRDLIGEPRCHPKPKVRLHAHRSLRTCWSSRPTCTARRSCYDLQPDLVRTTIRTLCQTSLAPQSRPGQGCWSTAIPPRVRLQSRAHRHG